MEVFIYQVVIAILILVAGTFGRKTRNVVALLICLFTVCEVYTSGLKILQFITIFIAYVLSIGYEEKKAEEKRLKKKEEFNYYVVDKKKTENSESNFGSFSILFIIMSSIFYTFYVFQNKAELKKESVEIKKDTVVEKKGTRLFDQAQETTPIENDVPNDISEKNYFSSDDNFVKYNKNVDSNIEYCINNDLSYEYEYAIVVKKDIKNQIDKILVQVRNKSTNEKVIQHISLINSNGNKSHLYDMTFANCNFVRSFITGFNISKEIVDGDFGDFIVCDFNFDGKEDFAIKIDNGGNGGAFYGYYIMGENGEYKLETFLTNEVGYFPDEIDLDSKTIKTDIHANVCGYYETVYMYAPETKKWKMIKREYINVCN